MAEPRIMDLYLHSAADGHIGRDDCHPQIVMAHNSLVEMVLELRKRIAKLELRTSSIDEFLLER